jgi:sulfate transport system substrate-binding protein
MRKDIWLKGTALALAAVVWTIAGCEPQQAPSRTPIRQTLVVYDFSVEEEVMTKEILPAFQTYWKQQAGEEVTFQSTFTGSEEISDAILGGARADVALLSNEQHAIWLRINGQIETDWRAFPHKGVVSASPIIIAVRPGNPLGIKDWADLTRPGVKVIQSDPHSSGCAQWALLAEYGSALMAGGEPGTAPKRLDEIQANVVSSPSSAREALKQFLFGAGDALVTYEQDVLLARSRGAAIEVVIPRSTIVSEHVVVIVDRNVADWEREVVKGFVNFLWSETAQKSFTRYYFRAVTDDTLNQAVSEFHKIERPFTVQDLGGWGKVYPEIIQGAWNGNK